MNKPKIVIVLILAALYAAIGGLAGFATVNAILLLLLGIDRYRWDRSRLAVLVIAAGLLILIVNHLLLLIVVVLVSLAAYYFRANPVTSEPISKKHKLLLNMRLDEQAWELRSLSYWHALGEIRLDLSQAVPAETETAIVLQGLVGDVDIIVPEDFGLAVEASVLLGQAELQQRKEGGVLNRQSWQSANYEQADHRVKLHLSYLVGDIRIRTI